MSTPTLSVVMINFNYSRYIEKAITTILEQSYVPVEFIIIDDCSTDDSILKIEKLFLNKSYCRLIRHSQNKGILYTLQEALHVAVGTHIYLASSDDYVEPEFFKKAMDLIERNPTVGLCCGKPVYFWDGREESRVIHQFLGMKDEVQIIASEELPFLFRKSNFSISGVTCIYRRDLMLKCGGFQPNLKSACDGFLIHQIAFRHPIGYIPEPFAAVRNHSSSYSAGVMQSKQARTRVFEELIHAVHQEEAVASFRKSGMLLYFGKRFLMYLLGRPKYWRFLLPIIAKQITHKKLKLFHTFQQRMPAMFFQN